MSHETLNLNADTVVEEAMVQAVAARAVADPGAGGQIAVSFHLSALGSRLSAFGAFG